MTFRGVEIFQTGSCGQLIETPSFLFTGRDPFLALRHFIEPPSFTNLSP